MRRLLKSMVDGGWCLSAHRSVPSGQPTQYCFLNRRAVDLGKHKPPFTWNVCSPLIWTIALVSLQMRWNQAISLRSRIRLRRHRAQLRIKLLEVFFRPARCSSRSCEIWRYGSKLTSPFGRNSDTASHHDHLCHIHNTQIHPQHRYQTPSVCGGSS